MEINENNEKENGTRHVGKRRAALRIDSGSSAACHRIDRNSRRICRGSISQCRRKISYLDIAHLVDSAAGQNDETCARQKKKPAAVSDAPNGESVASLNINGEQRPLSRTVRAELC